MGNSGSALANAIERDDLSALTTLLDQGAPGAARGKVWGRDFVTEALLRGQPPRVERSFGSQTQLLSLAVGLGRADMARLLLERGADPRARGRTFDYPPLEYGVVYLALLAGQGDLAHDLIRAGADVNFGLANNEHEGIFTSVPAPVLDAVKSSRFRYSPLTLAVALDREETVRLLLQHNADANSFARCPRCKYCTTPLTHAALHGSADVQRALLEGGADVGGGEAAAATWPLWGAVLAGSAEKAAMLLDHGADVNQRGHDIATLHAEDQPSHGGTALHTAAQTGAAETVALLLARGANASITNMDGLTPQRVAQVNHYDRVADLIAAHVGGQAPQVPPPPYPGKAAFFSAPP
jgi:ankyrin repeat protein